ncbi:hypothetical protein PBI_MORRISSEY_58 [Gordonia phage Morrissey]|nr:hypothetical protein PBI_MORRISSEY_58 [Gordonia phage Morrissey]
MAKGRKLTDAQVAELRERHQFLRDTEDHAGEHRNDSVNDAQVAQEFNISVSHVRELVMGRARPDAGGPIDKARQIRHTLFLQERIDLGDTEARRRLNLRSRNIDPNPKEIRYVQRVTVLDARGRDTNLSTVLEPGQSLRVDLVAEGGRP